MYRLVYTPFKISNVTIYNQQNNNCFTHLDIQNCKCVFIFRMIYTKNKCSSVYKQLHKGVLQSSNSLSF